MTKQRRCPLTKAQIQRKQAQIDAYEKHLIDSGRRTFRAKKTLASLAHLEAQRPCPDIGPAVSSEFAVVEEITSDALYIMENPRLPGEIKIGRSHNPEERAKQLSAGQNFRIVVKRSYGEKGFLEKTLHHKLQRRRVEHGPGVEWFNVSVDQADILVKAAIVEDDLSKL